MTTRKKRGGRSRRARKARVEKYVARAGKEAARARDSERIAAKMRAALGLGLEAMIQGIDWGSGPALTEAAFIEFLEEGMRWGKGKSRNIKLFSW